MINIKILDVDCADGILASINGANEEWFFGLGVMGIANSTDITGDIKVSAPSKLTSLFLGLSIKGVELEIRPND